MSRTRRRSTNRRRQDDRNLSIRAVRRNPPDAKKLSRAFIALALARAEADAEATASTPTPTAPTTNDGDDDEATDASA